MRKPTKKPRRNQKSRRGLVPDPGVEPGRPCGQWILNPSRLPIPPIRQRANVVSLTTLIYYHDFSKTQGGIFIKFHFSLFPLSLLATNAFPPYASKGITTKARKHKTPTKPKVSSGLVPDPGVEPGRPRGQWILNPSRLPIPPIRRRKREKPFSIKRQIYFNRVSLKRNPYFKIFSQKTLAPRASVITTAPSVAFQHSPLLLIFSQNNATPLALFRRDR